MKKTPISKAILQMLKRRQIVETSFSILKELLQIINKKARSITSFFSQALSTILAYTLDNNNRFLFRIKQFETRLNFLIQLASRYNNQHDNSFEAYSLLQFAFP